MCLLPKIVDEDAAQLKSNPDIMMDFFFEHLGVSEAGDGALETLSSEPSK